MKKTDIIIIGAGLSGLTCALRIQESGRNYLLIDKSDNIGGRVRSTYEGGFIFDHGFQVYNTAYNYGCEVLDYENLKFCSFKPGAKIYLNSKFEIISDPFKDIINFPKMVFSNISNFSDKIKILKMKFQLNNYEFHNDLSEDCTTIDYLERFGFSEYFIESFFRPFFGGVFLEKKLNTSAKFFKFVFSKFNSGTICLPEKGMQKIPDQLYKKLDEKSVLLNTDIKSVRDNILETKNGEKFQGKKIILCSYAQDIISNKNLEYNTVLCYYFASNKSIEDSNYIYLFPEEKLINNIAILSSISDSYSPKGITLFSITVIGYLGDPEKIINDLQDRLSVIFKFKSGDFEYLKHFKIFKGTMKQNKNYIFNNLNQIKDYVISGEQTTNGSIDGAIKSGLIAARKILN